MNSAVVLVNKLERDPSTYVERYQLFVGDRLEKQGDYPTSERDGLVLDAMGECFACALHESGVLRTGISLSTGFTYDPETGEFVNTPKTSIHNTRLDYLEHKINMELSRLVGCN